MKNGQNLRDLQQKKKEQEDEQYVKPQNCLVCNKTIPGAYAHHGHGWTCSATCMKVEDAKPRYPGHLAETFEKEHGL